MRHFIYNTNESMVLISTTEALIKSPECKAYKFTPDNDVPAIDGHNNGKYDIYTVDELSDGYYKQIGDYEFIEISKNNYENLYDRYARRTYKELCAKYKCIEQERDRYTKGELAKQRRVILADVLEYYKDEINIEIADTAEERYHDMLDKFTTETCPPSHLCSLYRKYIDFEVKKRILVFEETLLSRCKDERIRSVMDDFLCDIKRHPLFLMPVGNYVGKEISDFKNRFVDALVNMIGTRRGGHEYYEVMRRAGKLADLVEAELWNFYWLSIAELERPETKDED